MSAATDLLAQVHALGGVIRSGDGVGLEASPPGVLPDLLRNELQLHRADVIRALVGAALDHARALSEEWRRACYELGETAGWPALPFKPATSVGPGQALWRLWMKRASVPDMEIVFGALQSHLETMAQPP